MSKLAFKIYYSPDSNDKVLMEFLKSYSKRKGKTITEVILDTLRNHWLPIALNNLQDEDNIGLSDSFDLEESAWQSVGALSSQIGLITNQVDLGFDLSDLLSSFSNVDEEVNEKKKDDDSSPKFKGLGF